MNLLNVNIPMDFELFNVNTIITSAMPEYEIKAKKYCNADQSRTQNSFEKLHSLFIALTQREYTGDTCVISLQTQIEILQDLCRENEWINFRNMSVQQKFQAFPVIGRTLHLENISNVDGIMWKSFSIKVKALPRVHCTTNSLSLAPLVAYRDERWNCIVPSFRFSKKDMNEEEVKAVRQVMNHMVSSLVMGCSEFFIPDIIVALSASMAEYILKQSEIDSYMKKDLDLVEYLVDFYGSRKWRKYYLISTDIYGMSENSEWRKGLMTEMGPQGLKCEHVKKFVLAWFMRSRKDFSGISVKDLKTVYIQSLIESCGRYYSLQSSVSRAKPVYLKRMSMTEFLRRIIASKFNYVTMAYQSYHAEEFFGKFKDETMKILNNLSDAYIEMIHCVEKAFLPVLISDRIVELGRTFENLAEMMGMNRNCVGLTEHEILACLHIAFNCKVSYERNGVIHAETVIGMNEKSLFAMISDGKLRERFIKSVIDHIPGEWRSFFSVMSEGYHNMLPSPIPRWYCERLFLETGIDIEKKANIDRKTRLPRNACAHCRCQFFMKTVKSRKELISHLKCVESTFIPGFHKIVSDSKYADDLNGAIEAVKSGVVLRMPKEGELYLDDLKESISEAVMDGAQLRCIRYPDEYLSMIVKEGIESYKNPVFTYEEFKAAVLRNE